MLNIEQYSREKKNEWDFFVNGAKNGIFMHKRDFMDYHRDRFNDNSLMFYRNNELIALLPLSIKNNILHSHGGLTYGGFITNNDMKQHLMNECFEYLINYMESKNINKLEYKKIPYFYSRIPSEEDLYSLSYFGGAVSKIEPSSVINLSNPLKMSKGRKAQISRGKKFITIQRSFDFDTFIDLENEVLFSRHSTKAVHTAEELKLLQSFFENEIQLWASMYENKMIAATLLFIYDNVVHTQYMAANDTAREIGGLDTLIDFLIKKFAENKMYWDFGISSENNGQILNEGLISQKESFGARTVCYQTWNLQIEHK